MVKCQHKGTGVLRPGGLGLESDSWTEAYISLNHVSVHGFFLSHEITGHYTLHSVWGY